MASDLKTGRRRAGSSAHLSNHTRTASKAAANIQPKSTHTSDEFLKEFLNPYFNPASYLNAKLPKLATKSASGTSQTASGAVPLIELSKQANTLLSQVNAQTTRLSETLTQLTDDILRSGSRLAYEVELLRGETLGLSEALNETLKDDIEVFIPEGLHGSNEKHDISEDSHGGQKSDVKGLPIPTSENDTNSVDPLPIQQLKTLTLVRSRIDTVVKTFGDAMDFVFPPSEVSVTSSFLSVSAPEPGSEQQSSEDKGQEVLKKLREEISDLLYKSPDPIEGVEKAANRLEALSALARVWKDTAEENGRAKFIESLTKMVEDRHKELLKEYSQGNKKENRTDFSRVAKASAPAPAALGADEGKAPPGGFGLISQLQKLRGGV
ncbi:hypothetical protein VHEMI00712 [[Torrubiella] hemipterigena]|uniref:Uncharacterized protein n=1 Tax=[Torrubiella] hemipterigena TaxID=1531966 RepID=A0A0A1SJY7_9HYPO|nr:hypothetical protein VHEMI00712 [[Torrubiella] hemipterigena]